MPPVRRTSGAAHPLVLVPGLTCSPRIWASQIPALWPFGPVTVADHARASHVDAIATSILETAPPRFALAGVSLGGYIAFALWRAAPERITRLALIDTQATPDDAETAAARLRAMELERAGKSGAIIEVAFPTLVHPDHEDDDALRELMRVMREETGLEGALNQLEAARTRPDSRPDLPGISVPTLVLVGAGDRLTPVAKSREIAEAIPGARLAIIEDAGHMALVEQPERVNAELVRWLSD
jgi:pimeloyl-ACP methyl ester carboxylesterase